MKTPQEYVESLRRLHPIVYIKGKLVQSVPDEPLLWPGINAVSLTYDYALKPEYQEIMPSTLHLTGKQVSRLLHINTGTEDLLKKLEMTRLLCRTAGCAQRYLTHDALNALFETTHKIDHELSTEYHPRFLE